MSYPHCFYYSWHISLFWRDWIIVVGMALTAGGYLPQRQARAYYQCPGMTPRPVYDNYHVLPASRGMTGGSRRMSLPEVGARNWAGFQCIPILFIHIQYCLINFVLFHCHLSSSLSAH